jgi:hypothetical protein
MHLGVTIWFVAFSVLQVSGAAAQDFASYEGYFRVGPAGGTDPPEGTPEGTHLYIILTGDAAKALYDGLTVEPEYDVCTDGMLKSADGVVCSETECQFSIDMPQVKLAAGAWMC